MRDMGILFVTVWGLDCGGGYLGTAHDGVLVPAHELP